jgi:hypothetical protein
MTKTLITAALTGCIAWAASSSTAMADPLYVEVSTAPSHYDEYPHTYYEGRPVYYVNGHWYHRREGHWAYYREEPRPLVEFRASPRHHHYDRGPGPRAHHDYDRGAHHDHGARHEHHRH